MPIVRRLVFALTLALLCLPAYADDCGWLAASELDRLFPEQAPWRVLSGGDIGSCKFLSGAGGPPHLFGANQQILGSEPEALDFVRNLRGEVAKQFEVEDSPGLGEDGFTYHPGAARSLSYVGHRGRVAVIASLTLQGPVTPAQAAAGMELVQAALAVADDEEILAAASDCPWFDAEMVRAMLPGEGVTQQVYGETSCLAQNGEGGVLMVSAIEFASDPTPLLARRDGGCTWEEQPTLGAGAVLGYDCEGGNPRATLRFAADGKVLEYNLVPGAEPTEKQRQGLVDLGRRILEAPR